MKFYVSSFSLNAMVDWEDMKKTYNYPYSKDKWSLSTRQVDQESKSFGQHISNHTSYVPRLKAIVWTDDHLRGQ